MRTFFKIPYTTGSCKKVYLTLKRKGEESKIDNTSKHIIANRLAKDWGDINHSKTIFNKKGYLLKNYGCSGHGGYILITDKELPDMENSLSQGKYKPIDYFEGIEFYAYTFEEDCGWARLYKILAPDTFEIVAKEWEKNLIRPPKISLKEHAISSLKKWDKDFRFRGEPITLGDD